MVTENNMLRGLEKRQKGDVRKMRNTETLLSNIEGELNKWREENLKKERERVAIIQKTRYGWVWKISFINLGEATYDF